MGLDATPVDVLVDRTGLAAHVILQELTFLSLKGCVRRIDGQSYARRNGK
jgi:predicted Rossmann fold nucleotide-binding protein DprA/Smf involved in DNA uptake